MVKGESDYCETSATNGIPGFKGERCTLQTWKEPQKAEDALTLAEEQKETPRLFL